MEFPAPPALRVFFSLNTAELHAFGEGQNQNRPTAKTRVMRLTRDGAAGEADANVQYLRHLEKAGDAALRFAGA